MSANLPELRAARATDLAPVVKLLETCGLPTGDLTEVMLASFCVAGEGGIVVGVAGIEVLGSCALMRSLAVAPSQRGRGVAERLVEWCEVAARQRGVETNYLLTTTADEYFKKRGYAEVPRVAVPLAVAGHAQFRSLCPASAKCLAKRLS